MTLKKSKKTARPIRMPDTFIIIFLVVVFAAALTYIIPVGKYETQEITYRDAKGKEQTKTVVDADSYKMERDVQGRPVRRGIPIFKEGVLSFLTSSKSLLIGKSDSPTMLLRAWCQGISGDLQSDSSRFSL